MKQENYCTESAILLSLVEATNIWLEPRTLLFLLGDPFFAQAASAPPAAAGHTPELNSKNISSPISLYIGPF